MAELDLIQDDRPGIKKEIDSGAYDLIFQAIQEDMYTYPMRSFIRESVSNGLDAITERHVFEAIQAGNPVEEYYLQRNDGKLLKDSSFNAEYYNEAFLGSDPKVYVTYKENSPRDKVSIRDIGVGLGGSRLKGFFKLGYSSKRNMKHVIGKFGAGAKAGLATGVDYFTMTTTYNGFRTSFMIFKHDYDPITPEHANGKTETWEVEMADGRKTHKHIYWEPTTDKNGVEISLDVKKHNKKLCIDSVKSQFQYFNGRVHFTHVEDSGLRVTDKLDQKPSYESDVLLIPRYSTYNSPHILVDGISYGVVSWEELELERRVGRIAIKVRATDVDITQSRESLKWTEKTKKTILKAVEDAKDEASDYITKQLNLVDDQNIFELTRIYSNMHTKDTDSVNAVFKKFLDLNYIKAKFTLRGEFGAVPARMGYRLFEFLFYQFNVKRVTTYKEGAKTRIRTEKIESFSGLGSGKIVFAEQASLGPRLAVHLLDKFDAGHFLYVRKNLTRIKSVLELYGREYSTSMVESYTRELLLKYSDLVLDDYDVVYDESEDDLESEVKVKKESNLGAITRKANKEVLYMNYESEDLELTYRYSKWAYSRKKHVSKISDLEGRFKDKPIIIVPGKFAQLGRFLEIGHRLTTGEFPDNFVYVSQEVLKHFLPYGIVVTDYFRELNNETGELMVGKIIRDLNTLRIFRDIVSQNSGFATKFDVIGSLTEINMATYKSLSISSGNDNPRDVILQRTTIGSEMLTEVFAYLEVLEQFQDTVKTGDTELIAKQALELFGSDKIYHLDAYDAEFISTIREEFERLKPVHPILEVMYDSDSTEIKELLELLIKTKNKERDDHV